MQPGVFQVPVFVYPTPITFYLEDQNTHKHVLTLYNPYEFPIRFRVLCTAPNKYTVVDPEGSVRPKCCIDIVIRHSAVSPANCNVTDKFRIHMQNHTTKQLMGKQDVAATLLPGRPTGLMPEQEEFQRLPARLDLPTANIVQQQFGIVRDHRQGRIQTPNYIVVVAAIVCIVALLLPTQGDKDTKFPVYLHLTFNLKLVFAFVLGMVTMAILKPS
ncbi:motile sperm domain-containing protein 1-like isoform X2 [Periplaneta americana]|uniref:motile sperm domain-containing protein 1-like isoform X2 n=1 Tax=Periplaneta americana TaxID=6978 RepID=UPI0037E8E437